MANEINELDAIRNAVSSVATSVERLAQAHRKTQARLLAAEATLAAVVGSLEKRPAKDVFAELHRQADFLLSQNQSGQESGTDLSAIESILKSLQSRNLGQA